MLTIHSAVCFQVAYAVMLFFFFPLLVIRHAPNGSWTHGSPSTLLLQGEDIPFELELIHTVMLVFGYNLYMCMCSPYLLNASTFLWIDGFVFPS